MHERSKIQRLEVRESRGKRKLKSLKKFKDLREFEGALRIRENSRCEDSSCRKLSRWEFSRGVVKLSLRPTYQLSVDPGLALSGMSTEMNVFFSLYTIPSYIAMWVTVIRGFYEQESPHRVAFIGTLSRRIGMYEVSHVDKRDIDQYFHYKKISIFNKISESALFLRYFIFHMLQRYTIANNYHLFFY